MISTDKWEQCHQSSSFSRALRSAVPCQHGIWLQLGSTWQTLSCAWWEAMLQHLSAGANQKHCYKELPLLHNTMNALEEEHAILKGKKMLLSTSVHETAVQETWTNLSLLSFQWLHIIHKRGREKRAEVRKNWIEWVYKHIFYHPAKSSTAHPIIPHGCSTQSIFDRQVGKALHIFHPRLTEHRSKLQTAGQCCGLLLAWLCATGMEQEWPRFLSPQCHRQQGRERCNCFQTLIEIVSAPSFMQTFYLINARTETATVFKGPSVLTQPFCHSLGATQFASGSQTHCRTLINCRTKPSTSLRQVTPSLLLSCLATPQSQLRALRAEVTLNGLSWKWASFVGAEEGGLLRISSLGNGLSEAVRRKKGKYSIRS